MDEIGERPSPDQESSGPRTQFKVDSQTEKTTRLSIFKRAQIAIANSLLSHIGFNPGPSGRINPDHYVSSPSAHREEDEGEEKK